jgi:hypothetical protein
MQVESMIPGIEEEDGNITDWAKVQEIPEFRWLLKGKQTGYNETCNGHHQEKGIVNAEVINIILNR